MKIALTTVALAFVLMIFAPARSEALCWSYFPHTSPCTGTGGCSSHYSWSSCFDGCVSGTCNNSGGSGECCGHLYYTAVIYQDDGDCHGGACGEVRVHVSKNVPKRPALESQGVYYRLPGLRYIPDRCAHTYAVMIDESSRTHIGGL
jgi:hypothetical protein